MKKQVNNRGLTENDVVVFACGLCMLLAFAGFIYVATTSGPTPEQQAATAAEKARVEQYEKEKKEIEEWSHAKQLREMQEDKKKVEEPKQQ